jgi:hypothetical protein
LRLNADLAGKLEQAVRDSVAAAPPPAVPAQAEVAA